MRVIAGIVRGRRLKELQGMDTRPTTDKVKESMFNILQNEVEGRRVLDLFAGTGQLGLEALSRGAASCTFVEARRDAVALVRENLKVCGFQDQARVVQGDALSFLSTCREQYDLILLDPPYQSDLLENALNAIGKFDILAKYGIILCESAADGTFPPLAAPFEQGREYRYGKIKLTLVRRAGSEA